MKKLDSYLSGFLDGVKAVATTATAVAVAIATGMAITK